MYSFGSTLLLWMNTIHMFLLLNVLSDTHFASKVLPAAWGDERTSSAGIQPTHSDAGPGVLGSQGACGHSVL